MKRLFAYITILLLCVLLLTAPVSGAVKVAETKPDSPPLRVRIFDRFTTSPNEEGPLFLFFTEADIAEGYTGDILVLFGSVHLSGNIDGTVFTISSTITSSESADVSVEPLLSLLSFFVRTDTADGQRTYSDVIPNYILLLFWIVAETLICMMLYPVKPGFMEQNGVLLFIEPMLVLRNGLTAYFFFFALMIVFGLTVVLLPLALGIFLVMQVMIWFGEVALAITAGWMLSVRLLKKTYNNGYMIVSLLAIGFIKCIPVFSLPFTFFFLPILSLGLVTTGFINGWIHKKYYSTPFHDNPAKKAIDFSRIRGIIMNDTET